MVKSFTFEIDNVNTTQLHQEISESSISIAIDLINREDSSVDIVFKTDLSEGEFTTLSGVVDSHVPDYRFDPQTVLTAAKDPQTGDLKPNLPQRYAGDGKLRVLSSHKPIIAGKEAYNFFSSAGDDQGTGELAAGNLFRLACEPGTTVTGVDLKFTNASWPSEIVYIFGGGLAWEDAGWGDTVDLQIRSEATAVVPKSTAEGMGLDVDYNLDGNRIVYAGPGSGTHALGGYPRWVPNYSNTGHWSLDTQSMKAIPSSGTGYFDWFTEDVKVGEYVKNLIVYKNNYQYLLIDGTESAPLPYGTYFRIVGNNNSDTSWKVWGMMKMYRERLK